jgi:hypothetical protein
MMGMPLRTETGHAILRLLRKGSRLREERRRFFGFEKLHLAGELKRTQLQIELGIAVCGMSMRTTWPFQSDAMGGSISKLALPRECRVVTALETQ